MHGFGRRSLNRSTFQANCQVRKTSTTDAIANAGAIPAGILHLLLEFLNRRFRAHKDDCDIVSPAVTSTPRSGLAHTSQVVASRHDLSRVPSDARIDHRRVKPLLKNQRVVGWEATVSTFSPILGLSGH